MLQDTPPKNIISAESEHEQGDGKADDDGETKNLQRRSAQCAITTT